MITFDSTMNDRMDINLAQGNDNAALLSLASVPTGTCFSFWALLS